MKSSELFYFWKFAGRDKICMIHVQFYQLFLNGGKADLGLLLQFLLRKVFDCIKWEFLH